MQSSWVDAVDSRQFPTPVVVDQQRWGRAEPAPRLECLHRQLHLYPFERQEIVKYLGGRLVEFYGCTESVRSPPSARREAGTCSSRMCISRSSGTGKRRCR